MNRSRINAVAIGLLGVTMISGVAQADWRDFFRDVEPVTQETYDPAPIPNCGPYQVCLPTRPDLNEPAPLPTVEPISIPQPINPAPCFWGICNRPERPELPAIEPVIEPIITRPVMPNYPTPMAWE